MAFWFYLTLALLMAINCYATSVRGNQELESDELFQLSFEELLDVKVESGNLTGLSNQMAPVSVTTISHSEISVTPARNLYDLIEIYVPGAIWMNHHDSPKLGIRGTISDRNDKFLLLVNGRNMNNIARNGATVELENWDLNDIERVDVIRGPGSVTYGPGAVSGVINIITKTNNDSLKVVASAFHTYPYKSYGGNLSYSDSISGLKYYLFGIVVSTLGWQNTQGIMLFNTTLFGKMKNMGKDFKPSSNSKETLINNDPQDYMSDYEGKPQVKLNLDLNIFKQVNFFARYTSSGGTECSPYFKLSKPTGYLESGIPYGEPYNLKANRYQSLLFSLKNEHKFNNIFNLESVVSWSSQNIARRQEYFAVPWKSANLDESIVAQLMDPNSLRNKYVYYAEDVLNLRILNRSSFGDWLVTALGFEISNNHWGHPWGESRQNFRMGDKGNIISGTDSYCYGYEDYFGVKTGTGYFVGNGWSTNTFSLFGEANINMADKWTILISGRLDKNTYSDLLFSPRAALIYEINSQNFVKLIVQQSQRMNNAEQLFLQHSVGNVTTPETLSGAELIFSRVESQKWLFNFSGFLNSVEVLSWYDPDRTTRKTGDLSLLGIELECRYNDELFNVGINHSYTKQLSWKLADGIGSSGVSYSDYYVKLDSNSILVGTGNNLNNWSNNSTKLFANFNFMQKKLIIHLDARVFWGFEGAKDGVQMIKNAEKGNPQDSLMNSLVSYIDKQNLFGMDSRFNASISYILSKNISLTIFMQNILGSNNNYRYQYEAGNKNQTNLLRTGVVEEPFTVSFKLSAGF